MAPSRFPTRPLVLLLALLGAGTVMQAQAQAAASAGRACRSDVAQFCRGTAPGQGRVLACLKEHQAQLSATCRANLGTLQTCSDQARQLCADANGNAPQGRAALRQCLQTHHKAFSADCRSVLATR